MEDYVTWAQFVWIMGGIGAAGLLLFQLNRSQNNKIAEAQVQAENKLATAIDGLSKTVQALERNTLNHRASNEYVREVEERLTDRIRDLETNHKHGCPAE